jgi:Putative glutamine amidotransferase
VVGSVEASFFTADQQRMIAEFVSKRGGGLLALGGRHSFAEGGYASTPVAEVLPVVLEEGVPTQTPFFAQLKVEPTPFGLTHGVTQLAATEDLSRERWKTMPPLSAVNAVRRTRPGAVTLLLGRGDGNSAPQVVLAYQRYGAGRTLAFTAHDSWLWQMHADVPLEDMTHENLWRQLLRWLVSGVPGPVSVAVSPERTSPGAPVTITASVKDETFLDVNDARVVARVTGPSGAARELPLEWTVGKDGEYRATFSLGEKGRYEVRVEAQRAGKILGHDTAQTQAADLDTEYFGAEMRRPLLERIAEQTGGRFYTPETVGTLPADIAYSGGGATVREEKPLWDMPILFLAVVGLLSAEWGYRKRRGLA